MMVFKVIATIYRHLSRVQHHCVTRTTENLEIDEQPTKKQYM